MTAVRSELSPLLASKLPGLAELVVEELQGNGHLITTAE